MYYKLLYCFVLLLLLLFLSKVDSINSVLKIVHSIGLTSTESPVQFLGWLMEEESSDSRAVTPQQDDAKDKLEDAIVALRQEKARTKTYFTKARRRLLVLIQEKDVTVGAVQEACEALDDALETAMDTMISLTDKYKETRDRDSNSKLCQEIEKLEIEYSTAQRQAQEVLAEINEISNLNKFVKHLDSNVPRPLDSSELPAEGQSHSTEREKVQCDS